MILKILSKFTVPTFHFQTPPGSNLSRTLYPTLSPEAASRNRYSIMSIASTAESEINSWSTSSVDESYTPANEIKEVIPLISINAEQEIHRVACKTLQQCIDLLRCSLDDDNYNYESKFLPSSTIGKHVRHLYDHFRVLLESKQLKAKRTERCLEDYNDDDYEEHDSDSKFWTVNYDHRPKNISLETMRLTAVKQLEQLQDTILNDCTFIPLNTPIQVDATIDPEMSVEPILFQSTYGRELWFCCHHAIHHFASIKVICVERNIAVPEDFGAAPSTLKKERRESENTVEQE